MVMATCESGDVANVSNAETKNRTLMINEIQEGLKELLEELEEDEPKRGTRMVMVRIEKMLKTVNKLQVGEPGPEPDSGSDTDEDEVLERDLDLDLDEDLVMDREEIKKRKELEKMAFDPEEHKLKIQQLLTQPNDDPFLVKRPKHNKRLSILFGGSNLVYEPSLTGNDPETLRDLRGSAELAIGYYNTKHHTEYSVVDVVGAVKTLCAGHVLYLGFTAIKPGDADAKHFQTMIYYGIGVTTVKSVYVVD